MTSKTPRILPLLCLLAMGCGEAGSYELSWTLGKLDKTATPCVVSSVAVCSRAGLDSLKVAVVRGGSVEETALHPCYSQGEGALGHGPDLEDGAVTLRVTGLSPGGQTLSGPVEVQADIPLEGLVKVKLNLPRPAQCNDGVDNDGDGAVDEKDPDCGGKNTGTESAAPKDEC
jgi:hypothetical protein